MRHPVVCSAAKSSLGSGFLAAIAPQRAVGGAHQWAVGDVPQRAVGGMPYSLPLAMLQMDAEPGSLTTFSNQPWGQGPNADAKAPLASGRPQV